MSLPARVLLELTREQALVLFEWISREDDADRIPAEHYAERRVLWALEAQLERILVEPYLREYGELLAIARDRVDGDDDPY